MLWRWRLREALDHVLHLIEDLVLECQIVLAREWKLQLWLDVNRFLKQLCKPVQGAGI